MIHGKVIYMGDLPDDVKNRISIASAYAEGVEPVEGHYSHAVVMHVRNQDIKSESVRDACEKFAKKLEKQHVMVLCVPSESDKTYITFINLATMKHVNV